MLLSPQLNQLIVQEQQQDILRDLARQNLIKIAAQRRASLELSPLTNWLGSQMVKWGLKLQSYDPLVRAS